MVARLDQLLVNYLTKSNQIHKLSIQSLKKLQQGLVPLKMELQSSFFPLLSFRLKIYVQNFIAVLLIFI